MDDVTKFLFSTIFVLIGSLVFHISSLVSGFNVYRELPAHLSTLSSTIVGMILFFFSPLSAAILFPAVDSLNDGKEALSMYNSLLSTDNLVPFLGAAIGVGLVFGCLIKLKSRSAVLGWFRQHTGLSFQIYSYENAWDDFLSSVKRRGIIRVTSETKSIEGTLRSFSVRQEPRELVLEDWKEIDPKSKRAEDATEYSGRLLVTAADIQRIEAYPRSVRKHHESISHVSQAFYSLIVGYGLLLWAWSLYSTAQQTRIINPALQTVDLYEYFSVVLLIASIAILVLSMWVCRLDFEGWWASFALRPFVVITSVVGVTLCGLVLGMLFELALWNFALASLAAILILAIGYVAIGVRNAVSCALLDIGATVVKEKKSTGPLLFVRRLVMPAGTNKALRQFFLHVHQNRDLNALDAGADFEKVVKSAPKSDDTVRLLKKVRAIAKESTFLKNDKANVFALLVRRFARVRVIPGDTLAGS